MPILRPLSLLGCLLSVIACDGDPMRTDAGRDAGPEEDLLRADCEPLVPEFCALPFPSDYFLRADPSSPTGFRVALGATTLPRANTRGLLHVDPAPVNTRDGWSTNASMLAYLPGATTTGFATPLTIDLSLEPNSPTVLIDAATGERVPHFAEIDVSIDNADAPQAIIVRPVVHLAHATRYIVALRNVVDDAGTAIAPSPVFAALRDGTEYDHDYVRNRRAHFEALFTTLETNGVPRADLQLAWDFTTASQEDDTAWMISARDQAFAAVGEDGPDFRIDEIREFTVEENAHIARRVYGFMTVPLFLESVERSGLLNLGPDGMPEINGTAEFRFVASIPRSATPDTPARPIQYGHGLLGSYEQANAGWLAEFGNTNGFAPFGVDWIGMMENDTPSITIALSMGRIQDFRTVPERLVQGVINSLLAMRMMLRTFGNHPDLLVDGRSVIDGSAGFYTGDSQGGIFGGTYMALSLDVTRGILGVPGQPYNLLLNRSRDFDPYLALMRIAFNDGVDIQIGINVIQQIWDRADPGSFTPHIANDLFPGTPAHSVILQPAIGDQQVSTLAAHMMARAIGAVSIRPQTRPMWNIPEVDPPYVGSAIQEFDFGLPPEPITNTPPRQGEDPHGFVRRHPAALAQSLHFFETGEVIHTCDGPCDPE